MIDVDKFESLKNKIASDRTGMKKVVNGGELDIASRERGHVNHNQWCECK
jgi:hypothetical protein